VPREVVARAVQRQLHLLEGELESSTRTAWRTRDEPSSSGQSCSVMPSATRANVACSALRKTKPAGGGGWSCAYEEPNYSLPAEYSARSHKCNKGLHW